MKPTPVTTLVSMKRDLFALVRRLLGFRERAKVLGAFKRHDRPSYRLSPGRRPADLDVFDLERSVANVRRQPGVGWPAL